MPVPLLALRDSFNSVLSLGKSGILIDREHPDVFTHQAVRELNRLFPVALTDAEKRNSRAYNDFISNQIAIAKSLIKMFQMAIDERNRDYFTKEEMEKHLIQLIARLKEEEFFKKLKENGEQEAYFARLKDAAIVERLERELAMKEFVKALHEHNRILLIKRREHVDNFINSTIPLLNEIEIFKDLSPNEKNGLLNEAFAKALDVDKKYDRLLANFDDHPEAPRSSDAGSNSDQGHSASNHLKSKDTLLFAHQSAAGIEIQRKSAIKDVFSGLARDLFDSKGGVYSREDIDKGADIFLDKFNQEKVVAKQIDVIVERNKVSIERVNASIGNAKEERKDVTDALAFLDDIVRPNLKGPSRN